MTTSHLVGVDLGQAVDHTAFAWLERSGSPSAYVLRWLQRFPLGTPYTTQDGKEPGVVELVKELLARPPLPGCQCAVDQTGVGRPVVDMFRRARLGVSITPVTITAGHAASREPDGSYHVPKKDIVAVLQVLLGKGRLFIPAGLALAQDFLRELAEFRVKISASANEVFSAREGQHDDLVLAVGLGAWLGEHFPPLTAGSVGTSKNRTVAGAPRGAFGSGPSPFR